MDFFTYNNAINLLQTHGYSFIFLAMIIEGPITTAAGAFLASLGIFNIWIIFLLSIIGNLVSDLGFFALGRSGRKKVLEKYGGYIGLNQKRIKKIDKALMENPKKTIVAIKLSPIIAGEGIIVIGASKIKTKDFLKTSIITIVLISTFFTIAGYYFGFAFKTFSEYFNWLSGIIVFGILAIIIFPRLFKYLKYKLSKEIEKI